MSYVVLTDFPRISAINTSPDIKRKYDVLMQSVIIQVNTSSGNCVSEKPCWQERTAKSTPFHSLLGFVLSRVTS